MKQKRSVWRCSSCGYEAVRWFGYCHHCGSYGSALEESREGTAKVDAPSPSRHGVQVLGQVQAGGLQVFSSGSQEFDRVLGRGMVPGSFCLITGEPGVGKSTLLLSLADFVARSGRRVLYVAGEEHPTELRRRAERLGSALPEELAVTRETQLERLVGLIAAHKPQLLIVDSIQTLQSQEVAGIAGKPSQLEEVARRLSACAADGPMAIFAVGHMTKDDTLAGPRLIEHLADQVLYVEGDRHRELRFVRALKNRYGATGEVAILEMTETGLKDVLDPSQALLAERPQGAAGSVVVPAMEGSRVLLVEVQALLAPARFAAPRARGRGVAADRLEMVLAVLENRTFLSFERADVFVNVPGGYTITEPAVDLGMALALASASLRRPVPEGLGAAGEIGLTGELRSVKRLRERREALERAGLGQLVAADAAPTLSIALKKANLVPEVQRTGSER